MRQNTPNHSSPQIRITLIDDDASVRSSVSRLVRSHGFACTAIESGEMALADPHIAESDCMIMDVQLAGIDGFETRDRLHSKGIHIPTIFITAHSEFDSPEWVARTKGSRCLSKPFEESELMGTIRLLLDGRLT
jgi:FixJ family two-component response regulator